MQRFLAQMIGRLLVTIFLLIAVTVGAFAANSRVTQGEWRLPELDIIAERIRGISRPDVSPSKVIFLHRAALEVSGGGDDARLGSSSLISSGETYFTPKYKSSDASWKRLKRCVVDKFQSYDVVVTDVRPQRESYILVKVGGKAADIGRDNKKLGGIAPFNQRAIPNSIVFVFDQGGRMRTKNNCEAVAHEVGHVYGLDHTYECKDIMSYRRGCGAKKFVDSPMKCGEKTTRECEDGETTQNSSVRLRQMLGPASRE